MSEIVRLLTFAETAEALRVSPRTLQEILKRGELRGRKVGGQWRIRADELDRYLGGQECPSISAQTAIIGMTSVSPASDTAETPSNVW